MRSGRRWTPSGADVRLVGTALTYRPPPSFADRPDLAAAFAEGERDRLAGRRPRDWSDEEPRRVP